MVLEEGEPLAGPWEVIPVSALAERLMAAAGAPSGRPRIIAVDGRGGAGKTRLADALAAHVPQSATVHTDDVAWHHSFFGWGEIMAAHVLEPLRAGEAVDYRPPGWIDKGRPGSIALPRGLDAVWIEGCGSIRRQLAPFVDASVWMQVDRHEAERRLLARDGDSQAQLQLIEAWDREERPFRLQEQPWKHATVVVAAGSALVQTPPGHVAVAPPVR
jgi:hypothetical protein